MKAALIEHARKAGIAKHPDIVGAAREGIASLFLAENLPATVHFLTGEIFDSSDARSGQIDLIVYPAKSPRLCLFGKIHLVPSDFVISAIEVKSTLTTAGADNPSHLRSALESCRRVKGLHRHYPIQGVINSEVVTLLQTPYMIFAYDGPSRETLERHLHEYRQANGLALSMMPDLIAVMSRDYYLVQNNGWLIKSVPGGVAWSCNNSSHATLLGMYAYLTKLIEAYAVSSYNMPFTSYLRDI